MANENTQNQADQAKPSSDQKPEKSTAPAETNKNEPARK
jgi:hypothetical protein